MADKGKYSPEESLRSEFQTRHPGLKDEIEGAINTLRKIQKIATASNAGYDASVEASVNGTSAIDVAPRFSEHDQTEATSDVDVSADDNVRQDVPLLAAGETFGRYQISRLLGRGAMGAVYLAYDGQLQRYVALKTPSIEKKIGVIERFHREARAAAQIRNPYICPIYDVGRIGNVHYLSMAYIDGVPLKRAITEGRFQSIKEIIEVVMKVARGLHKAHEQGIIHRDLKPENIMIDTDGEPIVMDFGLARKVDDDIQLTTPGRIIGTPAYMSPEQVEGDSSKLGPATDIYSLGVVLFVMLTGQLPFQGSLTSVLRKIVSEDPPRPSKVKPELASEPELEFICLKMMAKSPADRFSSMAEVALALEELIRPKDTKPVRTSVWKRISGWFQTRFSKRPEPQASVPDFSPTEDRLQDASVVLSPTEDRNGRKSSPTIDVAQIPPESSQENPQESRTVDVAFNSNASHQGLEQESQTSDLSIPAQQDLARDLPTLDESTEEERGHHGSQTFPGLAPPT